MTDWVRLWHDMPTDPKWRVIARRSGQPLTSVLSVFVFMMTNASANADERGTITSWENEDVAAALDIEPEAVAAILEAMQGKVVDGLRLTGWERRQPKREDASAERVAKHRAAKRDAEKRAVTQGNAPETDTDTDTDTEVSDPVGSAETDASAEPDYRDLMWTEGAETVARLTGKPIDRAKSFIGKCLKEAKDDCRLVLTKIRQAEADRVIDPPAWIAAAVKAQPPPAAANDLTASIMAFANQHGAAH